MLRIDIGFARCIIKCSQKFFPGSIQVPAHAEHHAPAEVKARHWAVAFRAETALEEVPGECAQIFLKSLFNRSAVLSSLPFRQKRLQTRIRGPDVIGESLRFVLRQWRSARCSAQFV